MKITRRRALLTAAAGSVLSPASQGEGWAQTATPGETESYGLSTFGDLALPSDFNNFGYVNPDAPKGGTLVIQVSEISGNQNFDTFDTFNIYVFKGDGAAGMDATFDTLMAASGDEPGSLYGLLAKSVRTSADKLTYTFQLRPEARFHDGSRLTAKDVAFSMMSLKTKGHPSYRVVLEELIGAEPEGDDIVVVRLAPNRSRDIHLVVAGLPVFSSNWFAGRDFEASTLEPPLGSGPYKVARFEQGRYVEYERVKDYWAAKLPVNVGVNNFDRMRYEYYRERQVAFEDFKTGKINWREENTSRIWATQYDFPAVKDGRVKKEEIPNGRPKTRQGWFFNTRRPQFKDPRIREAIGCCFDFEWTRKNIMYGSYLRQTSYFQSTDMEAKAPPGPDELALLEPFRARLSADVFGEPFVPPVSDGSGSDRNLLRRADELFRAAGCKRDGARLLLPSGEQLAMEFLDFQTGLQPHTEPFIANLKKLGVDARMRVVDTVQYKRRTDAFDFDIVSQNMSGSLTPGIALLNVYGAKAATTPGSSNLAGIADPVVDMLLDRIAKATTREELNTAGRALDRVLRAGRYMVPMWYQPMLRVAFWDVFRRPERMPKYDHGAPGTWWFDADQAKKVGWTG